MNLLPLLLIVLLVGAYLRLAVHVCDSQERVVIHRMGKLAGTRGAGLFLTIPLLDKMERVSTKTIMEDPRAQSAVTSDNVAVTVDAVVYYKVVDAVDAVENVNHFGDATVQIALTALREAIGAHNLAEFLTQLAVVEADIRERANEQTSNWGVEVTSVNLTDLKLPENMERALARRAQAVEESEALRVAALAESDAAGHLSMAAAKMAAYPSAMQLRYLQSMTEASKGDNTSTYVLPFPVEMMRHMLDGITTGAPGTPLVPPPPPAPPDPGRPFDHQTDLEH
ncbi:MAG: SPFH domain-containing protein [Thermoleophilia bacterium]